MRLAALVAELAPDWSVRFAHLELAEPSIPEGIDACVRDGADEVRVHPLFLAPGRHLSADIPGLVREASDRHPGVRITLTEPLGASPALAALIVESARKG